MSLVLEDAEDSFGLCYSIVSEKPCDSLFCVPRSRLSVTFDVKFNGVYLPQESQAAIILQKSLSNSLLWPALMFTVVPGREKASLSIDLMCSLFGAILPDVANLPVERMEKLQVTLEYWTSASQCYFESVYRHFQYLLVSLIFKLEYDYPFVFSFYGKHLVQINYRNLVQVHKELAAPLSAKLLVPSESKNPPNLPEQVSANSVKSYSVVREEPVSTSNSVCALSTVFLKLQKHILHEFNTLNVMKECDSNSHRRKQCKNSWIKSNSGSFKGLVFSPSVLEDLHLA